MNFKCLLITLLLICSNTYGQGYSRDRDIMLRYIQPVVKDTAAEKKDTVIAPRNFFNEIDFSYFKINKSIKPVLKYIQPKKENSKEYFFLILCILAAVVVYIRYHYAKEIVDIIKSTFSISQSFEKEISFNKMILMINYLITCVILLFFIAKYFLKNNSLSDQNLLIIIATTIVSIAFIRFVLFRFLGFVFDMKEIVLSYQVTNDHINYVTGLILLPILISEIYSHTKISPILLYIGFFTLLINILYKLFKNILLHTQLMIYNLFHFIIYFCAVEIFPYLILNKFFREQIF